MNALVKSDNKALTIEQVLIGGDLSKLTSEQRVEYYHRVCETVGLNPLTQPFAYLNLNGKLTLYALRACTDQLRTVHGVSVEEMTESERDGVFIVTTKVRNKEGRTDMAKGAVNISGLKGEALANALMKTETKSKRRATLSICGLSLLDETEVETIPGAKTEPATEIKPTVIAAQPIEPPHDPETGELGPHSIATTSAGNGKINWVAWGSKLIAAFKASKSAGELSEWIAANNDALDECERSAPKAYASIIGAYKKAQELVPAITSEATTDASGLV